MADADSAAPEFDFSRFRDFLTVMRRPSAAGLTIEGVYDPETPVEALANLNILCVGAGGIGCELMHALAVSPLCYCNFFLVDLDEIDLTNLNRQFLFRMEHVGQFKAEVAAKEIKKRFPFMRITPINKPIQELHCDFYRSLHFIMLGLDSVSARQWINSTMSTLYFEELAKANGDVEGFLPCNMIDAGTEGYKGSVRRIEFTKTPCIQCLMYQFPTGKNVPMCTLENIPRIPAHCVLYVKEKVFADEKPFKDEDGVPLTKPIGDDEDHITWIMERALARAKQFGIDHEGIDFRFTQGVVKNVVPAVGFSNALVGATMVNEAIKLFTGYSTSSKPQIQYDGSCALGQGSTTPLTFCDYECTECSERKFTRCALNSKLSDVVKAAWTKSIEGTELADTLSKKNNQEYPNRLKATLSVNLSDFVAHPQTHPNYIGGEGKNPSITETHFATREARIPIAADTVFTVTFQLISAQSEDGDAKKKQENIPQVEDDGIYDLNGMKVLKCMVVME